MNDWIEINLPWSSWESYPGKWTGQVKESLGVKKYLIGDICENGGQSNEFGLDNDAIVLRYRIVWERD